MAKRYTSDAISSDDVNDIYVEQEALSELGYRGNKNLRRSGVQQKWTKKQLIEYKKCHDDPIYFIKKYVKIVHVDKGIVPFELWDFQVKLIEDLHNNRYVAGLWPRQSGKSTTIAAYMLHFVMFNGNKKCAILANKASGAREILGRIQMAYELLPFWMKMGVLDWNKGNLNLENGSSIIASATSSSAIRGQSCIIGSSLVTVKDKVTGEIKEVTIKELSDELKANSSKNSKCINNREEILFNITIEDEKCKMNNG